MKRLLIAVAAVACASLLTMQARATVTINVSAIDAYDNNGTPLPADNTSTVLLVEDENGLGAPTANIAQGTSLTVGSLLFSDYLVIGSWDMSTSGSPGVFGLDSASGLTLGAFGSGTLTATKQLDLLWFPYLAGPGGNVGASTAYQGGYYGSIYGGNPANDGSDPWVVPADGSTVGIYILTSNNGGSTPDASMDATHIVVPEPSSIMLVAVGLLGGLGLIRRRR